MKKTMQKIFSAIGNEDLSKFACKSFLRIQALKNGLKINFNVNNIEITKIKSKIIVANKHLVYAVDLINSFDFYFNQVVAEKIDSFDVVDYSCFKKHILKDVNIPFYFTSLAEGKKTADSYLKYYRPKQGDIVFDCGAYCGSITYFLSQAVGMTGKVFAFEPDEENFECLLKNIELHNLTNVVPVKKGIWSLSTVLEFNTEGNLGGAITDFTERLFDKNIQKIEVVSFTDFCKEFNLDKVDFVKMDIEGAEIEAIRAAKDFIRERDINFAVASYHIVDGKMTYETIEKDFSETGYEFKTIKSSGKIANEILTYAWSSK